MSDDTMSAKGLASALGVDPKLFRRYVRDLAANGDGSIIACGSGNRYAFTRAEARMLVDGFAAWRKRRSVSGPSLSADAVRAWLDDEGDEGDTLDVIAADDEGDTLDVEGDA